MKSAPRWSEVVAIYGGAFDPPHLGHRMAVEGLFKNPGVSRVIIIPTGIPALKAGWTGSRDRFRMAELCFDPDRQPRFSGAIEISNLEILRTERNPAAPSYTFDTLQELRSKFRSIAFVIGTDQLINLEKWHRFPELLSLSHWIILRRKGVSGSAFLSVLRRWQTGGLIETDPTEPDAWKVLRPKGGETQRIRLVETQAPECSSNEIRQAIQKTGVIPSGVLSPEVAQYLKERGLYGTRSGESNS